MKAFSWFRWRAGRRFVIGVPYLWLVVFFVLPFLILLRISVTDMGDGVDPFAPLIDSASGAWHLILKYDNYVSIFRNPEEGASAVWGNTLYLDAYRTSLKYAFLTTLLCLVIGYPFAYFLARAKPSIRPALLMLVMLPFWTSFLLRVYAWKGLLGEGGWVAELLLYAGLDGPMAAAGMITSAGKFMNTPFSLVIGMAYTYLPFMVLPLYANLAKMDLRLLEAAADLGASRFVAFWLITVPLSKAGIIAGSMLVFIPCVGEFVIPELLGGPQTLMIGRVLWDEFFSNNDWPMASTVTVVLVLLIVVPLAVFNKYQAETQERGR